MTCLIVVVFVCHHYIISSLGKKMFCRLVQTQQQQQRFVWRVLDLCTLMSLNYYLLLIEFEDFRIAWNMAQRRRQRC